MALFGLIVLEHPAAVHFEHQEMIVVRAEGDRMGVVLGPVLVLQQLRGIDQIGIVELDEIGQIDHHLLRKKLLIFGVPVAGCQPRVRIYGRTVRPTADRLSQEHGQLVSVHGAVPSRPGRCR